MTGDANDPVPECLRAIPARLAAIGVDTGDMKV
jgi:hypothetical protein